MNFNKFMALSIVGAAAMFGFSSCSDDDPSGDDGNKGGQVSIESVFPAGVPEQVGSNEIVTNDKGQVIEVKSEYSVAEFDYNPVSRATNFDMSVKYYDIDEYTGKKELDCTFYLQLNENGFVKYALEVYEDEDEEDTDEWWFGYNADGQLNYMKRSENDNDVVTLEYKDGDAVKCIEKDGETGEIEVTEIYYTNVDVTTPIANKGGIMLFDDCFGLDMDEMDVCYYAGLLGKATKHLPVEQIADYYRYRYNWTLNSNGLPTEMTESEIDAEGNVIWTSQDGYTFKW